MCTISFDVRYKPFGQSLFTINDLIDFRGHFDNNTRTRSNPRCIDNFRKLVSHWEEQYSTKALTKIINHFSNKRTTRYMKMLQWNEIVQHNMSCFIRHLQNRSIRGINSSLQVKPEAVWNPMHENSSALVNVLQMYNSSQVSQIDSNPMCSSVQVESKNLVSCRCHWNGRTWHDHYRQQKPSSIQQALLGNTLHLIEINCGQIRAAALRKLKWYLAAWDDIPIPPKLTISYLAS